LGDDESQNRWPQVRGKNTPRSGKKPEIYFGLGKIDNLKKSQRIFK